MSIIVFGASGGIGSRLCQEMTQSDESVVPVFREASSEDGGMNDRVVLGQSTWQGYQDAVAEAFGRSDETSGLVNCIGSVALKPLHAVKENEFDAVIDTNLKSSAAILSAAIPFFRKSKSKNKSVVLISTVATGVGLPNHELISAAKAGIEGMALSAAASYAKAGIRVNVVAPSLTKTPMTERFWGNERSLQVSESMHAIGRIGEPSDITEAIRWLLSEKSSWVTGQVLRVDGGLSCIKN